MEALRLTPAYKDYLWGGQRLKNEYGKITDLPVVAESWELSLNDAGLSSVANTGVTLREWLRYPQGFPILVKLIDAKEDLSVQVHPGDAYAQRVEGGFGKTELWYVVDHDPDAALYIGFNRRVTRSEVEEAVRSHRLRELLRRVSVRRGDVYFIPAGTVHAIGKGNLLAEIQQNSDVTYRLYDYGRRGADGKPRELHVEKALEVMDFDQAPPIVMSGEILRSDDACRETLLNACPYFRVHSVETVRESVFETAGAGCFELLLFLGGAGIVALDGVHGSPISVCKGESVFINSGPGRYRIGGSATFLRVLGRCVAAMDGYKPL
ncbi:MAG: class I mannose-6-phosphate isomerase [Clostridiales Family XIII bacterium]|jgi:mannose-6-phosphate isomerase|nr:class I mannose-6-phosphate isomerase [Clostridiales Family XIII bacterium]